MVFAKIHNLYDKLTKTEQKIASFVLTSPDRALTMTAKELAAECETAASAVIRFCKSVGYNGFSELKIELARSVGSYNADDVSRLPSLAFGDKVENVFKSVFGSAQKTMAETLQMLDYDKLERIAKIIKKSKRLYFMGVGTSSVIATDASYRFAQLGLNSTASTDIVFMSVNAINAQPGDVVVLISHSGRTKVVVDSMRLAKKSGATTVALSSFVSSPLATESDYAIITSADEENYPSEAVSARVAHVCVMDALAMSVASLDVEAFERHVVRRNGILKEIRY